MSEVLVHSPISIYRLISDLSDSISCLRNRSFADIDSSLIFRCFWSRNVNCLSRNIRYRIVAQLSIFFTTILRLWYRSFADIDSSLIIRCFWKALSRSFANLWWTYVCAWRRSDLCLWNRFFHFVLRIYSVLLRHSTLRWNCQCFASPFLSSASFVSVAFRGIQGFFHFSPLERELCSETSSSVGLVILKQAWYTSLINRFFISNTNNSDLP